MAKSKAKKKLDHKLRQMDNDILIHPSNKRGSWGNVNPVTKSIPNKKRRFLEEEAKGLDKEDF
jgi:hypothetical protein